ncbi:TetR/AcrR family transcriptional regulator [Sphingobium sp.]|uniref:TetR/AcrR family transcriptional regulator n=1 Tax=Sphingobium sp. TaxID=1912891 RepID=UPI003BB6DBDA
MADGSSLKPIGRREHNKQEKRRRIILAARALFHEQGFEATTIAQIAKRARIAEGTLFLYVSRKEDLLILAFTDEMREVASDAFEAIDPTAHFIDQMIVFFGYILAYHDADVVLAKAFLREVGFLRDPQRDYGFSEIPLMINLAIIADRAKARGDIANEFSSDDIAALAFSAYWHCLRDWANDAVDIEMFHERLRRLLTMHVRGLAACRHELG